MSINVSDIAPSPYVASDDFKVGALLPPMVIEAISIGQVPTPGKRDKQSKAVVRFAKAHKGYVLTKNVARAIARRLRIATENIDKEWVGIKVQFKVVGDVRRPDGTKGNAFRLHEAWLADGTQPVNEPINNQAPNDETETSS
jgi:hypothetical protein